MFEKFLRNSWAGNAEQSLRRMIVPASIWVKMKWWGWEDAGKALLRCRGLPGTGRLANRSNSLSRRALLCLKPLLWSLQDRSALAPDLESGNLMGFLFLDLSSEALLSCSVFSKAENSSASVQWELSRLTARLGGCFKYLSWAAVIGNEGMYFTQNPILAPCPLWGKVCWISVFIVAPEYRICHCLQLVFPSNIL